MVFVAWYCSNSIQENINDASTQKIGLIKTIYLLTYHGIWFPWLLILFFFLLSFSINCGKSTFPHFSSSTFFSIVGIFPSYGNKLQDYWSIKCIFRRIFLPLQQFGTLSSPEILVIEFSWHLISTRFCLKVANFFATFAIFSSIKK